MPVDFFATELARIQDRFNQTFGNTIVCNIQTRQQTILAIIGMSLAKRKIEKAETKDAVRHDIRRFIRTQQILNQIFDDIKRSNHVERTDQRKTFRDTKTLRNRTRTA